MLYDVSIYNIIKEDEKHMNLSLITPPLIGAVIGYATNYIAIKMMFRPLKPIKIKNHTLPFTPGIIPKEKPRLAKAIASTISTSLLSKDILQETLLSDEMKEKVAQGVHQLIQKLQEDPRTIEELTTTYIDSERFDQYKSDAIDYIAIRIDAELKENPVGEFIAGEVIRTVKEHTKGGLLSLFANDNLLNSIGGKIQQGVDDYLAENTIALVVPKITKECDKLLSVSLDSLGEKIQVQEEAIQKTVLKLYEKLLQDQLDTIITSIDIAGIVKKRINEMDMLELEKLILSVMNKELHAIVNLGALIGFILGLFNLIF